MSEQELQFHYFKMHDSDNNNKLDGCELVKSLIHWHGTGIRLYLFLFFFPGEISKEVRILNQLIVSIDYFFNASLQLKFLKELNFYFKNFNLGLLPFPLFS